MITRQSLFIGFGVLLFSGLACTSSPGSSSGTQGSAAGSSASTTSGGASGKASAGASGGVSAPGGAAGSSAAVGGAAGSSTADSGGRSSASTSTDGGGTSSQNAGASAGKTSNGGSGGQGSAGKTASGGDAGGQSSSTASAGVSGGSTSAGGTVAGGATADTGVGGKGGSSASASTDAPDAGRDTGTGQTAFSCNLVFGNTTTQQWFNGGFLTYAGIDASRWELIAVGHHYIGAWAQANDVGWTTAFDSNHKCAVDAQNPERVIFIVTQAPPYSTAKQYQTDITAIVKNIKAKYSKVKRIELTTLIRSPGNSPTACSSKSGNEQSMPAVEDEGLAAVAADPAFAGLVFVLPPFYVTACSDFNQDAPQYTDKGATNIAKVYGAYFAANP